jgi:hypothetical protein
MCLPRPNEFKSGLFPSGEKGFYVRCWSGWPESHARWLAYALIGLRLAPEQLLRKADGKQELQASFKPFAEFHFIPQ